MSKSPLVGYVVKELSSDSEGYEESFIDEFGNEVITFQVEKGAKVITEVKTSTNVVKCEENVEIRENERLIELESDNVAKTENLKKQYTVRIVVVDRHLEEIIDVCHAGF